MQESVACDFYTNLMSAALHIYGADKSDCAFLKFRISAERGKIMLAAQLDCCLSHCLQIQLFRKLCGKLPFKLARRFGIPDAEQIWLLLGIEPRMKTG